MFREDWNSKQAFYDFVILKARLSHHRKEVPYYMNVIQARAVDFANSAVLDRETPTGFVYGQPDQTLWHFLRSPIECAPVSRLTSMCTDIKTFYKDVEMLLEKMCPGCNITCMMIKYTEAVKVVFSDGMHQYQRTSIRCDPDFDRCVTMSILKGMGYMLAKMNPDFELGVVCDDLIEEILKDIP